MLDIKGASAIVTGGASGLGEATVRALSDAGAHVVILDLERQADRAEVIAKETGALFAPADVREEAEVIAAVDAALELAPLKVLVNCAGMGVPVRTIGRDGAYESAFPLELWKRIVDINLVGTFNCLRLAATAMSRNEPDADGQRGSIVNTASAAAFEGQIGQSPYSAAKGGIVGMTIAVARDLAAAGIRVNTIAPGLIDTPIYGEGPESEEFKAKLSRDVLFPNRLGISSEFASMVIEVVRNSYMNGSVVRLDAGLRMQPK